MFVSTLDEACAVARREVTAWRKLPLAGRSGLFASLQAQTAPFSLSGLAHDLPEADDLDAIASMIPGTHAHEPTRTLVVGDSISRELALSLTALLPARDRGSLLTRKQLDASNGGINRFSTSAVEFRFHPRSSLFHDWLARRETHYAKETHWFETNMTRVLEQLESCEVDTLYLGGHGSWRMRRGFRRVDKTLRGSPVHYHESFVRVEMAMAACLASELGADIVYVGSLPVNAPTVLLDPPKHDWSELLDLTLAELWAAVEQEVFTSHFNRSTMLQLKQQQQQQVQQQQLWAEQQQHSQQQTAGLHFLPLAALSDYCPLARCDGMHFASDYPAFGCRSSLAVWHRFMRRFLTTGAPAILGTPAEAKLRRCQARRVERRAQQQAEARAAAAATSASGATEHAARVSSTPAWKVLDVCGRRVNASLPVSLDRRRRYM